MKTFRLHLLLSMITLCLCFALANTSYAQPDSPDSFSEFVEATPMEMEAEIYDGAEYTLDTDEVQETFKQVLADPEYRHLFKKFDPATNSEDPKLPKWLEDFFKWLFGGSQTRRTPVSPDSMIALSTILFWIVVIIVAGMLIVLLMSLLSIENRDSASFLDQIADQEALAPTQPPGDLPTNEYERRAIIAAREGDFRTGMRELVLGSMSWTERAGMIRYRRGLTNRDYVRAVWRLEDRRKSMLKIVSIFEYVFYGRRKANAKAFKVCLEEFRKSFSQEGDHAHLED